MWELFAQENQATLLPELVATGVAHPGWRTDSKARGGGVILSVLYIYIYSMHTMYYYVYLKLGLRG